MLNPINPHFDDCYFSVGDGFAESCHVFVEGSGLLEHAEGSQCVTVGETGFGTGLNFLASALALQAAGWTGQLCWWSVELYPLAADDIRDYLAAFKLPDGLLSIFLREWTGSEELVHGAGPWRKASFQWQSIQLSFSVYMGDVLSMLSALPQKMGGAAMDCWMLDGHSPEKNPDMWQAEVFAGIARCSRSATQKLPTSLSTYSAAGLVKEGLRNVGFRIVRRPGFGKKRHMIQGWYEGVQPVTSIS